MLGRRIRTLRKTLGMNQEQFGKELGVTKQSVCNWENGNIQPSIDMLVRIATKYAVSSDYLLGLHDLTTLDVSGLTQEQILHLQNLINDLRKTK